MRLDKLQIFLLLLIVFFVITNVIYVIDTKDKSLIVNDRQWADTYEYRHWVKVNNIELSIINTNVHAFNSHNPFGLTYDISLRIRYKKNNEIKAKADIERFKLVSHTDMMAMENLKKVPISDKKLELNDFLIFTDGPLGKDFFEHDDDTEYMYGDMASIQFYTNFFTDKYIEFKGSEGGRLFVKTNPILLFKSFEFQTFFWILLIALSLTIIFSVGIEYFLFIFTLAIIAQTQYASYSFWYNLGLLFIISIISKVKMRKIYPVDIKNFKRFIPIASVTFVGVFIYLYTTRTSVPSKMILYLIIFSILITVLAILLLVAGIKFLQMIYMYLRYKGNDVETIDVENVADVSIKGIFRSFPVHKCDVVVNGERISDVYLGIMAYQQVTNKRKKKYITTYKTDAKGNYIFY